MENVMAKSDLIFRGMFEAKMYELFPEVATKGVVSRPQLLETMAHMNTEKYPLWLMKNKAGRGLSASEGGTPVDFPTAGNTALKPKKQESFMVDYTDTQALIPAKESIFVPFGNYQIGRAHV